MVLGQQQLLERARRVKLILMDVDGVLTDGTIFYTAGPDGKPCEFKGFNSQDGLGFHFLNQCGITTGVISGRDSIAVTERARILGIKYVYQGFLDKIATYEQVLTQAGITAQETVFIGDDFTDWPLMDRSAIGVAVANARPELLQGADYITRVRGGDGALREIAEIVIKAQDKWHLVLDKYGIAV